MVLGYTTEYCANCEKHTVYEFVLEDGKFKKRCKKCHERHELELLSD